MWVGKAEPGSQGQEKVGMKAQECQGLCIWFKTGDLGVELSGAGMLWGAATPQNLLWRVNPFSAWPHLGFLQGSLAQKSRDGHGELVGSPSLEMLQSPGTSLSCELKLSLNTQPRALFLTLRFKQHFYTFIPGPAEKQQVLNWSKKSFSEIRNVK